MRDPLGGRNASIYSGWPDHYGGAALASIILRKDGRAEIRESYSTPRGPRSRTLAVFRELTDRDLEKAQRRASRPFDRARIMARAGALGVPRFGESASRAARALLSELQADRPLAPSLVTALRDALAHHPARELPASIGPLQRWLGASEEERGEALRECMHPALLGSSGLAKGTPADEKVALIVNRLEHAGIPHAFGGQLALGYYAAPEEATPVAAGAYVALPLFVFEEAHRTGRLLSTLERLGVEVDRAAAARQLRKSGMETLRWESTSIVVSCAHDPYHDAMRRRIRAVPFGEDEISILSAEDLLVALAVGGLGGGDTSAQSSDRSPAWWWTTLIEQVRTSIEQLLFARVGELDLAYVRDWLDRILGPADPRRLRFEEITRGLLGDHYLFYGTTLTCHVDAGEGWVVNQVFVLPGEVSLPDPHTEAFGRLARGAAEAPLAKKAAVRDETARIPGLHAGTYTVVATGYELADPRHRTMTSQVLTLHEGVEQAALRLSF